MKKMKTTQIIMRPFLNFQVRQNHKTEFLNCNDALAAVNEIRLAKGMAEKQLADFFKGDHSEYLAALCKYLNKQMFLNYDNSHELKPEDLIHIKRGKYGGTWLHPFYYAKFARWLSPEFEAMVDIWISDNVLMLRDNGGDLFKKTVAKFVSAKVFGHVTIDAWNLATQEQLHEREMLLQRIRNAAEFGNFESVDNLLEKI